MKTAEINNKYGRICGRLAAITLAVLLAVVSLPVNFAFAAADSEKAIREVHNVTVGGKDYCFFVTHNVVMTPKEIADLKEDDALTSEILKRAGLYMKERNCKLAAHKAIEPAAWKKTGGEMFLGDVEIYEEAIPEGGGEGEGGETPDGGSDGDVKPSETSEASGGTLVKMSAVEALRKAVPGEGDPVRLEMDLIVATEGQKGGDKDKLPSTHKEKNPNAPKLIYIAVATEADAQKFGEEICKEEPTKTTPSKSSSKKVKPVTPTTKEEKEILPEERTISMTDRSGGPLEPTLKDGDPVTLEWREPGKQTDGSKKLGFFDHAWAVPALIAAALAIILAVVFIIRKKDEEETEE